MVHLPDLIQDLGLILMAAAVVTLIFRMIRQPVVLGYLIAGMLVGPHFHLVPTVKDVANISIWAEIGVIFMLFGLGLEFSFKKLVKVGKSAGITATFEIIFMIAVGYVVGMALGWSKMDSLFLGAILSMSSTTIIVRAFDELGMKTRGFASLVFGVLIVEDLIAILLLVLLSSVAATQSLSGTALLGSSLRLSFFLILWFLLGIYLLPTLFDKIRKALSDETTLIISIGLCLMMVIIATGVGFSPALGAFVMGSILAETREGHRIERVILSVKDLFSAVFFVSVGMMIDPAIMREHFGVIVFLTFLTIVGKFISSGLGALISGRSLKHSIQGGLSLAQIGEFSFIIATLGKTLGVTSDFLYPIAVAVSGVTTFTTPYQIKNSEKFYNWLNRRIPNSFRQLLARYETAMSGGGDANVIGLVFREYGAKILLNAVLVVALSLALSRAGLPRLRDGFGEVPYLNLMVCGVALLLSAPFLWAIFLGRPAHAESYGEATVNRLRRLQLGITSVRFMFGVALVIFVVSQFTSVLALSGLVLIALAALATLFFTRFSEPLYEKMERRFVANLNENERLALERHKNLHPALAPWDAVLVEMKVSASSPLVAKTLLQSQLKEKYGVTIAMIDRGGRRILSPKRDDLLLPGDEIFLIGTDEQLASARPEIESAIPEELPPMSESYGLTSLTLLPTDPFVNKPIRECGLREAIDGLIVGLERDGKRYLSPDSSMALLPGDLVWIVGDRSRIREFRGN